MLKSIQSIAVISIVALILSACNPTTEELVKQGDEYIKNRNYEDAIMCYQKAAERGSGDAQNSLAVIYFTDIPVARDYNAAAKWAAMALENKDYFESLLVLGSCYYEGQGVPQDYTKAADLLERLASMGAEGKKMASYMLFKMYLNGLGVPQSDDKAVEYYCISQDVRREKAVFEIGKMYYYGDGVSPHFLNEMKGSEMITEAANNGCQEAVEWINAWYKKSWYLLNGLSN